MAAPAWVRWGFFVLPILVGGLVAFLPALSARRRSEASRVVRRRALFGVGFLALWLAIPAGAAASGVLLEFDERPPPLMVLVFAFTIVNVALAASSLGAELARSVPLSLLVGFQVFRLPLEIVMHGAASVGLMPMHMSYSGMNYDIVTGVTAGLLAVSLWRGRAPLALIGAWNSMGFVLLAAIVTISILSTPMFEYFGPDRVVTFVGRWPYVWLPTVLVQSALFGHLVVARAFFRLRAESEEPTLT